MANIRAEIDHLSVEVADIKTGEDVDALDGVLEQVLLHLEHASLRVSSGLESLLADVAIALAVRGQIDEGLAKRSLE